MEQPPVDQLESDPEYAIAAIRAYLAGGGHLSAGEAGALLDEIERLWGEMEDMGNQIEKLVEETAGDERERAVSLLKHNARAYDVHPDGEVIARILRQQIKELLS